jgi:hypothetical protein
MRVLAITQHQHPERHFVIEGQLMRLGSLCCDARRACFRASSTILACGVLVYVLCSVLLILFVSISHALVDCVSIFVTVQLYQ